MPKIKKVNFSGARYLYCMSTTQPTSKALVTRPQVIKQIIHFFKSLSAGDNDAIGRDSAKDIMADLSTMWSCPHCTALANNFWCHVVPLDTPVVVSCHHISPISLLTFFVVRKAKLSLHRLENAEFNDGEWERIKNALEALREVELVVHDLRHEDGDVEFDTTTDYTHITF
jgi:hypothetical protein